MSGQHPGDRKPWPYPFWIAHRGAGKLAPENTMAAFRRGAAYGYHMFECDVQVSADGVPFLLHDSSLRRTTNHRQLTGAGVSALAGAHAWADLSRLDAGSWLDARFESEPLPSLGTVARWCLSENRMLNIEIKPAPGAGVRTGECVARQAALLWQGAPIAPLITSFDEQALDAARRVAPDLPRGLLLDKLEPGWLDRAVELGCVAVVCDHRLCSARHVKQVQRAGLRSLGYTVNTRRAVERLRRLGTDGIITDRVDRFAPD